MPVPTVTVIEDDEDMLHSVCSFLQSKGIPAWGASSAEQFYMRLLREKVDMAIVDLGLPGEAGISLIERLATQHVPVIALTGLGETDMRIKTLEAGALQYFVKPADLDELVAGIRAQWRYARRQSRDPAPVEVTVARPGWTLDLISYSLVTPLGESVRMTGGEFELVRYLMKAQGAIVNKVDLVRMLGYLEEEDGIHSIDSHLARLRRKTLMQTGQALPIRSVFGKGLAFVQ